MMRVLVVRNKENFIFQKQVQGLKQSIKSHVCTILVPSESTNPLENLIKVMEKLIISDVELKKIQDNLTQVKEQLDIKEATKYNKRKQ